MSNEVVFSETMIPTISKEKFLSNDKNKNRLIAQIMNRFAISNMHCKQAKEDGDTLIIKTALDMAPNNENVVVIGEDVDLLVILIGLCHHTNVYFLKPGKCKSTQNIYSPISAIDRISAKHILFLHAMSGCDTTSALYNQGKIKFHKILKNNNDLQNEVEVFKNPDVDAECVANAGLLFLESLYRFCGKTQTSLNKLRYKYYINSALKTTANMASLPPTEDAARLHSLRVYHQVQQWLGHEKLPEEWGWKRNKSGLTPITTLQPPAPEIVLKQISCKCKKYCRGNCGCKKAGLYCSLFCLNCDNHCENINVLNDDDDDLECEIEDTIEHELTSESQPNPISDEDRGYKNEVSEEYDLNQPGPSKRAKCS